MNELLELNRKFLIKGYLWISGILTIGFSFFLYFFHSEISTNWIFIIYSLTLVVLPLIVVGTWTMDWFRKRRFKNRILSQKPYSELEKIGFNKKTIKPNHNSLLDYVQFCEINDCKIVFDIDIKNPKIAEFSIYGLNYELTDNEFKNKLKELESQNIYFNYYRFIKKIKTKKQQISAIQELEKILTEFTHIVKKLKYEPIPITEWKKI